MGQQNISLLMFEYCCSKVMVSNCWGDQTRKGFFILCHASYKWSTNIVFSLMMGAHHLCGRPLLLVWLFLSLYKSIFHQLFLPWPPLHSRITLTGLNKQQHCYCYCEAKNMLILWCSVYQRRCWLLMK